MHKVNAYSRYQYLKMNLFACPQGRNAKSTKIWISCLILKSVHMKKLVMLHSDLPVSILMTVDLTSEHHCFLCWPSPRWIFPVDHPSIFSYNLINGKVNYSYFRWRVHPSYKIRWDRLVFWSGIALSCRSRFMLICARMYISFFC